MASPHLARRVTRRGGRGTFLPMHRVLLAIHLLVMASVAVWWFTRDEASAPAIPAHDTARAEAQRDPLRAEFEPAHRANAQAIAEAPAITGAPVEGVERWLARFVRAEDRAPVPNAVLRRLEVVGVGGAYDSISGALVTPGAEEARADARGRVELVLGERTPDRLYVEAPGRAPIVVATMQPAERGAARDYALERAAQLVVRVHDRASKPEGVLAARLTTTPGELMPARDREELGVLPEFLRWSTAVDARGGAVLEALPVLAPLALEITRGLETVYLHGERLILQPGESRELDIDIGAGTRLSVRVVDQAEQPVANTYVGLTRRGIEAAARSPRALLPSNAPIAFETKRLTDADGVAVFEGVAADAWWVAVEPTRAPWDPEVANAVAPCAKRVAIETWERTHEVTLEAARGLYLRGRVETPDAPVLAPGAPARTTPEVVLIAHAVGMGGGLTGDPLADGTFALGPVTEGEYAIETFSRKYAPTAPVRARGDGPPIVIRMELGARIDGRVVDGATGVRCDVVLARVDGAQPEVLGSSDAEGRFAFGGITPGEYVVSAYTQTSRLASSARVAAGADAAAIVLDLLPVDRTGIARIALEGAVEHGRIGLWQDGVCCSARFVSAAGVFTLCGRAGPAELRFADEHGLIERRAVELAGGATTDVRIER